MKKILSRFFGLKRLICMVQRGVRETPLRKPNSRGMLCIALFSIFPALAHPQMVSDLPNLGDATGDVLSPQMERKVGNSIVRELRRNRELYADAELEQYLNELGNVLVLNSQNRESDFYFFAVKDSTINAFALPGGNIGVHTGLLMAAQSESELASVLAHEIGHVQQRHIARMLAKQKQSSVLSMAAFVLAALAARSNPEAAQGILAAGTGLQVQGQLNFGRDAEREADRVGFQTLQRAGFATQDMVSFFGRLQQAGRLYENNAPAYLRTHPLTSERIADVQNRVREARTKQRADSLEFLLLRAKLFALRDESTQGLIDARKAFEEQLQKRTATHEASAWFGLATVQLAQRDFSGARQSLLNSQQALQKTTQKVSTQAPNANASRPPMLERLAIELDIAEKKYDSAVSLARAAVKRWSTSRALAHTYARALQAAGRKADHEEAITFLREQTSLYRQDATAFELLAASYAATNQRAQQYYATGELYVLLGSYPAAIEQMQMARRAGDADFYSMSVIDARLREVQTLWAEEQRER